MKRIVLSLVCSLLLFGASAANALTVTSDYQGWVNSNGLGNGGYSGNNTFTGNEFGLRFNSWASFNLSSLSGTVGSATLLLNLATYPSNSPVLYSVNISDVNTPLTSFLSASSGVAGYTDLGTGGLYGTVTGNNGLYSVALDSQAVADINASAGGTFIVGFTNATLNTQNPDGVDIGIYNNGFWGGKDAPQLELNPVATPEPSTFVLIGAGLAGLTLVRRRAKKQEQQI